MDFRGQDNPMKNIFVGNLSFQTTEQELYAAFSAYGNVERVSIVTDRDSGQPRGFAVVEMTERRDAETAIAQLNGVELKGKALTVNVHDSSPSSRGAGGPAKGQRSRSEFGSRSGASRTPERHIQAGAIDKGDDQSPVLRAQATIKTDDACIVDLEAIVTVAARAVEVFGNRKKAIDWLRTPLPVLSHRTPISMLETPDGIVRVEDVLGRIEHGVW
jgi:cold-inducible RNA-binding protein